MRTRSRALRTSAVVALALAGALAFSACSSATEPESTATDAAASASSTAAPSGESSAPASDAPQASGAYGEFVASYPDCAAAGAALGDLVGDRVLDEASSSIDSSTAQCVWAADDGATTRLSVTPGTGSLSSQEEAEAAGATIIDDADVTAAGGQAFGGVAEGGTVVVVETPDIAGALGDIIEGGAAADTAPMLTTLKELLAIG